MTKMSEKRPLKEEQFVISRPLVTDIFLGAPHKSSLVTAATRNDAALKGATSATNVDVAPRCSSPHNYREQADNTIFQLMLRENEELFGMRSEKLPFTGLLLKVYPGKAGWQFNWLKFGLSFGLKNGLRFHFDYVTCSYLNYQ